MRISLITPVKPINFKSAKNLKNKTVAETATIIAATAAACAKSINQINQKPKKVEQPLNKKVSTIQENAEEIKKLIEKKLKEADKLFLSGEKNEQGEQVAKITQTQDNCKMMEEYAKDGKTLIRKSECVREKDGFQYLIHEYGKNGKIKTTYYYDNCSKDIYHSYVEYNENGDKCYNFINGKLNRFKDGGKDFLFDSDGKYVKSE